MKKELIILSIFLMFSLSVDAESLCRSMGGECFFEHELECSEYEGRLVCHCPDDIPRKVDGYDGERFCESEGLGRGIEGAAIADITGWALEGNVCCLPQVGGEGRNVIYRCGDEIIQRPNDDGVNEVCDMYALGGETCISLGYERGGILRCRNDCRAYDASGCRNAVLVGTVFTTREVFSGNLGGLSGADSKCQRAANNANLDGTWIALLDYLLPGGERRLISHSATARLPISFNGPIHNMHEDLVSDSVGVAIDPDNDRDRRRLYNLFYSRNNDENLITPRNNLEYDEYGVRIGISDSNRIVWIGWLGGREDCDNHYMDYYMENYVRRGGSGGHLTYCDNEDVDADNIDDPVGDIEIGDFGGDTIGWDIAQGGQACVGKPNDIYSLNSYARSSCAYSASLYCIKLPMEVKFDVTGESEICEKDELNYRITLTNNGADLRNVEIVDVVTTLNGNFIISRSRSCGDVRRGRTCVRDFSVRLENDGVYSHNPYAIVDGVWLAGVQDVVGNIEDIDVDVGIIGDINVIDENVEGCCTPERNYRSSNDGRVCCNGMPEEYVPPVEGAGGRGLRINENACGCPTGFIWVEPERDPISGEIIPGYCRYQPTRCGYVQERNVCTLLEILRNPFECLFGGPESKEANRGDLPYEQACCIDRSYEGEEYYTWKPIEIF